MSSCGEAPHCVEADIFLFVTCDKERTSTNMSEFQSRTSMGGSRSGQTGFMDEKSHDLLYALQRSLDNALAKLRDVARGDGTKYVKGVTMIPAMMDDPLVLAEETSRVRDELPPADAALRHTIKRYARLKGEEAHVCSLDQFLRSFLVYASREAAVQNGSYANENTLSRQSLLITVLRRTLRDCAHRAPTSSARQAMKQKIEPHDSMSAVASLHDEDEESLVEQHSALEDRMASDLASALEGGDPGMDTSSHRPSKASRKSKKKPKSREENELEETIPEEDELGPPVEEKSISLLSILSRQSERELQALDAQEEDRSYASRLSKASKSSRTSKKSGRRKDGSGVSVRKKMESLAEEEAHGLGEEYSILHRE
jgi:hypothetical protein